MPADALDDRMMGLALRLARNGRPSPNPHVGAIIARGEQVIGTGFHERAGLPHAEVAAINDATEDVRGATLYVTFEPCNHFGRTPPCTEAIIERGIARVVVGCRDPKPHVPGAIERLRAAGIQVDVGVREAQAHRLIADFSKHITTGLPFVTLKAALTLDGRIATRTGDSRWITGLSARKEVHRMRAYADAVLVGIGTALADNPELTVRHVRGVDPLRVVLDSELRLPLDSHLATTASKVKTLVFHGPRVLPERHAALSERKVELVEIPHEAQGLSLPAVLRELGARDVVRLLVEGGARVHGDFLVQGLADRAAVFVAPRILGDREALTFATGRTALRMEDALSLEALRMRRLGSDVLIEGDFPRIETR